MSSNTNNQRINFASIKNPMKYPDFLEVQLKSFQDFLQLDTPPEKRKNDGLYKVFAENFPIADTRNNFVLEFLDYYIDPPHYTIDDCLERGLTYSVPLKAKLKLYCTDPDHEDFDTVIQDVYLGPIPYMTPKGTFVINGAERVVVSQLHRSPGVFFGQSIHANGTKLYSARIIPFKGSWIEFATDINNVMYAYIDRKKKLPVTTLLRAVGFENDKDILEIFNLAEDVKVNKANLKKIIGRKLAARVLKTWTEDFVDEDTGEVVSIERNEVVIDRETVIEPEHIDLILESGIQNILVHNEEANSSDYSIIFNTLQKDPSNSEKEAVLYIYRQLRNADPADDASAREVINNLFFSEKRYDLGEVGRYRINKKLNLDTPMDVKVLTKQDIIEIIKYLIELINSKADVDDIDHLSNRRVRTVGEQLSNQFAIGLARMSRTIRERMNVRDNEVFTPIDLINAKTISSVINSFFGTNALSQFMDQTNPLAEITHKRRLSALGPGGLSRDRAGFEVRDVHYTHYGRLCPIETPEGPNIGLINSLASYAIINKYGFIETPYRRVSWDTHKVTDKIDYLTADEEDNYIIAGANTPLNDDGSFKEDIILARQKEDNVEVTPDKIDYMDVIPKQVVSVASACIPFLENDDSNRALMGANQQRQAAPLINPHSSLVGTGMEYRAAHDSGAALIAKAAGTVEYVDADEIRIRREDGTLDKYTLEKYRRSNNSKSYNQTPNVKLGDHVDESDVIANGPTMDHGELALGQNPLIAFMTWNMYNYEDAIMLSERLVKDDVYTSISIEDYESEARDTKLGPEEITRELPNIGEDALKDLDADGIVRVGAEVHDGDILVGKVTPKGVTELSAEERLLHAIFGEKAREVRDTSLRVPHGGGGIVQDVKVYTREAGDELSPGVNTMVRVYIAQKRKIQVGDKMSGRHGNKGTVAAVMPEEDMPYLPDGTPVDICLNPMGVPSRMNIGQLLELHLGAAARQLGIHVATPVFDGANENDVWDTVRQAGMDKDGKTVIYDGRTGEPFHNRVSVGVMHYLKLTHMVDDKIHARSIGPYSLVTQQPLGGKAQFGGQRFGEMEVWALEAYGAAYTLQEILTYKSDDVVGRVKAYEAIVKGERIPKPGVPESFRVLVKELQSLGLDIRVLDMDHNEIELRDMDEDSSEHLNIDTLSRMAEEQEKKKLAEETGKSENKEDSNETADKPVAPADESDGKVSK